MKTGVSGIRDLRGLLERTATARRRAVTSLEAARGGALLLAAWLAACLLDNLVSLPSLLRIALLLALVPGGLWFVGRRVAAAAGRRANRAEAARLLEIRLDLPGNPLIDAVLFEEDLARGDPSICPEFAEQVLEEARRASARLDTDAVRDHDRLHKAGIALAGAAVAAAAYGLLLPSLASGALARFANPLSETAVETGLSIEVAPGSARLSAGQVLSVRATVSARGTTALPDDATLEIETTDGASRRLPMLGVGAAGGAAKRAAAPLGPRRFDGRVDGATAGFRYRVAAGDARSPWFGVVVVPPPALKSLAVRLEPPAYTGRPAEDLAAGETRIEALVGTKATLTLVPDRPCRAAVLRVPGEDPQRVLRVPGKDQPLAVPMSATAGGAFVASFEVVAGGPLTASLVGHDGVENPEALKGAVASFEDAPPIVRLEVDPPQRVAPPNARVEMPLRADDDVGLALVRLVASVEGESKEVEIWKIGFPAPGPRAARERVDVVLDPGGFEPGRTYKFVAEATDRAPGKERIARSAPVLVRIQGPEDLSVARGSPLARAFERLRALLEAARAERGRAGSLLDLYAEHVREGRLALRVRASQQGHEELAKSEREAEALFRADPTGTQTAEALARLAAGDLADARRDLAEVASLRGGADGRPALTRVRDADDRIVARLLALLGDLAGAPKGKDGEPPIVKPEDRPAEDPRAKLADDLRKFAEEQRKIIELTKELEQKGMDNLSEGDEELLGRLAAQEAKWAKILEEDFTDLSKVPKQDFDQGKLLDELNQVYMEVQKAADALSAKKIELAVPLEQSGLELAEKLETNIERWLPDTKDHEKWVMEEPPQEMDVPLADLPDELEDIVGDLLDDEEEMDEDVEDVSSSWMDSIDKGAGWDATDGPISNMSARGVTGNRLPNQNEVGGRSGEGRSGKSHGEMVEKTAEGKGGRETPTRETPDPFEAGSVQDSSRDPRGGATGGGKLAGQGETGLRGAPPPPVQAKLDRLRGNQGELRQQAERLRRWLRAMHLPAADLEEAVANMERIEKAIAQGRGFDLRQAHADVKASLEAARRALAAEADTIREREAALPPEIRRELFSGIREPVPEGLAEIVRVYFETLSRGGTPGAGTGTGK